MSEGPTPRLRRAEPADLARVGAVTVAACGRFVEGEVHAAYRARLADATERHRDADLWVAELDGAVVGTVTLCPEGSPWREVAIPGEGEFRMLAVDPAVQGRGVGASLVRLALAESAAARCTAVTLCSLVAMDSAHRLYERLGFTRLPERDWAPAPGIDLIAFRRPLAAGTVEP